MRLIKPNTNKLRSRMLKNIKNAISVFFIVFSIASYASSTIAVRCGASETITGPINTSFALSLTTSGIGLGEDNIWLWGGKRVKLGKDDIMFEFRVIATCINDNLTEEMSNNNAINMGAGTNLTCPDGSGIKVQYVSDQCPAKDNNKVVYYVGDLKIKGKSSNSRAEYSAFTINTNTNDDQQYLKMQQNLKSQKDLLSEAQKLDNNLQSELGDVKTELQQKKPQLNEQQNQKLLDRQEFIEQLQKTVKDVKLQLQQTKQQSIKSVEQLQEQLQNKLENIELQLQKIKQQSTKQSNQSNEFAKITKCMAATQTLLAVGCFYVLYKLYTGIGESK